MHTQNRGATMINVVGNRNRSQTFIAVSHGGAAAAGENAIAIGNTTIGKMITSCNGKTVDLGRGEVTINGVKHTLPPGRISVVNDQILINGEPWDPPESEEPKKRLKRGDDTVTRKLALSDQVKVTIKGVQQVNISGARTGIRTPELFLRATIPDTERSKIIFQADGYVDLSACEGVMSSRVVVVLPDTVTQLQVTDVDTVIVKEWESRESSITLNNITDECNISNVVAGGISVNAKEAAIAIRQVNARSLQVETVSAFGGGVDMDNCIVDEKLVVSTVVGDIDVHWCVSPNATITTVKGEVHVHTTDLTGGTIHTNIGNIELRNTGVASVTTVTGDITGSGPKIEEMSSHTGTIKYIARN